MRSGGRARAETPSSLAPSRCRTWPRRDGPSWPRWPGSPPKRSVPTPPPWGASGSSSTTKGSLGVCPHRRPPGDYPGALLRLAGAQLWARPPGHGDHLPRRHAGLYRLSRPARAPGRRDFVRTDAGAPPPGGGHRSHKTPRVDRALPLVVVEAEKLPRPPQPQGPGSARAPARPRHPAHPVRHGDAPREEVSRLNREDVDDGWSGQALITGKGTRTCRLLYRRGPRQRAGLPGRPRRSLRPPFLRHDQRRGRARASGDNLRLSPRGSGASSSATLPWPAWTPRPTTSATPRPPPCSIAAPSSPRCRTSSATPPRRRPRRSTPTTRRPTYGTPLTATAPPWPKLRQGRPLPPPFGETADRCPAPGAGGRTINSSASSPVGVFHHQRLV